MSEYVTVFEIPSNWTDYFFILSIFCSIIGAGLAVASFVYLLMNWRKLRADKKLRKESICVFFFILMWGSVWTAGSCAILDNIRFGHQLIDAYYSDNYEIVEGVIEVLHQQPKSGHDSGDLIRIDHVEIEFSYFSSSPAYTQTLSHGGVLADDVYAKIYFYKGHILRIDIPKTEGCINSDK